MYLNLPQHHLSHLAHHTIHLTYIYITPNQHTTLHKYTEQYTLTPTALYSHWERTEPTLPSFIYVCSYEEWGLRRLRISDGGYTCMCSNMGVRVEGI